MKSLRAVGMGALLLACSLLLWINPTPAAAGAQPQIQVIHELKHDVSLPLRDMARNAPAPIPGMVEMREHRSPHHFAVSPGVDTAAQEEVLPDLNINQGLSFDGVTGTQGGAIPPDTNGSVGTTQFVEITNFDYAVYNKTTGATILAPTRINAIWAGFGGQCQTNNGGDPIVLWDKLAQRWLVEQLEYFISGHNLVCVAISTSADATGTYNRYAFDFGSPLPDYPHIGVWPDAYYLGVNSFGAGFGQPCALDRISMLAGTTATMVCFSPNAANFGFLPSDVDGTTPPPAGAPNHFMELGTNTSSITYWDFHVDFAVPPNSTFTGPHNITVPTYVLLCGGGGGACISQPSPGSLLDALGDRMMFRNAYRNFGDHEAMVVAHSVKPSQGTGQSAMRWYELRSTPVGGAFSLFQTGTFQNKTITLWMGSIAMDKVGNIAMGMSADNKTNLKPSIVVTGRVPTDPAGKMQSPVVVVKGTGVQTGTNRWGDYSSMSVDPSDDCTFWYTTEYAKTNGTNWSTHMFSFKFPSCQ